MSRGLPKSVKDNLEKCRSSAIAAVTAYNTPGLSFRTPLFLVLNIISWTALFHAIFYKRRKKPWYKKRDSSRYIYVDGEPKHWELTECLRQYFKDKNPPQRKNLEFLIGLRNKIEHRHLPDLEPTLYGECQASLMNLEDLINKEFGQKFGLAEQLAISLQFSRSTPAEKKSATKRLAQSDAKGVTEYIENFRGKLDSTVIDDQRYSFSVFLVPKVANRASAADVAVEFVHAKDLSEDELERLEKLNVLIREKKIPIANLDYYRPGEVVQELVRRVPYHVTMQTHTDSWRFFEVRPPYKSDNPQDTRAEYCVFNKTHNDYIYTNAWIEKLVKALSDPIRYTEITGREPQQK